MTIGQTSTFTGLNFTGTYNNRLQPVEIKASSTGGNAIDITYGFVDPSTSKNAGHVYSITNNLDSTRSQTFTYDQLNRLITAQTTSTHATSPTHCWGETYSLDTWGNLLSSAATTNSNYTGCTVESGFTKTADVSNHLSGFSYDASGNTLGDGVNTYTWDGESQLKSGGGVNYLYDGAGRRVAKVGSKLYWYGSGGEILAETDAAGNTLNEYIFFGGKRVALLPSSGNAQYYAEDLLGTSRVMTTNAGVVCYDADFYPFGGERTPYTSTCTQNNYKFEGKERDTETGNDDFGARYYSWRFGRWLSSDWSAVPVAVPYANLTNPQTLNLYSMVSDDPETSADLDGHTSTSEYQVANPEASSAWNPGFASENFDLTKYTQVQLDLMASRAAAALLQQIAANQQTGQPPKTKSTTPDVERSGRYALVPTDFCPVGAGDMQRVFVPGEVDYNGNKVSDPAVRGELMHISLYFGLPVEVTSGDRVTVLPVGAKDRSLHLQFRAADFHVGGLSDKEAFASMRSAHLIDGGFGLLRHGAFSETGAAHLHLEHRYSSAPGTYGVEGLTRATRGVYTRLQEQQ
jgi:RHS repeat-associated protein